MANQKGLLTGFGQTGRWEPDLEYLAGTQKQAKFGRTGRVWNDGHGTAHWSRKAPIPEDK